MSAVSSRIRISIVILIFVLYILWSHHININLTSVTSIVTPQCSYTSHPDLLRDTSHVNGWQPIGHTYEEQIHLRNMSTIVAL